MESLGELAGDAQGRGVAGACGIADFNEAGGGELGNAEGEALGAAHEDVAGWPSTRTAGGPKLSGPR